MRSPLNAILLLAERCTVDGRPAGGHPGASDGPGASAAFGLTTLADDVIELAHSGNRRRRAPCHFSLSSVLKVVGDLVQPRQELSHCEQPVRGRRAWGIASRSVVCC
jgi:hypothetical protein